MKSILIKDTTSMERDKTYKIPSGKVVFTCFSSDFLLKDADEWRPDCWRMMRQRQDLFFYFFTKRIDRFEECLPSDWGDGSPNVMVGCTVENQEMADYRLPIFKSLPILHKSGIDYGLGRKEFQFTTEPKLW